MTPIAFGGNELQSFHMQLDTNADRGEVLSLKAFPVEWNPLRYCSNDRKRLLRRVRRVELLCEKSTRSNTIK